MSYEARVLPELLEILKSGPIFDLDKDLEKMRNLSVPEISKAEDIIIKTQFIKGTEADLLIKVYEPKARGRKKLPAVLWMHGGGYVLGHPDSDDGICESIALKAYCTVVSVDYRLAPENLFPAAIEDCYSALKWMVDNAECLNIDTSKVAIAGASAGGGLTAALALMARDKGGPNIIFQMPLYPMLDDRNESPSSFEINEETLPNAWNRESNIKAWRMYLGSDREEVSCYAAPARAESLKGLPPAYICVGELDPFRDENIEYVKRLLQAGVPVEFHIYPGCFHGFDAIFNDTEICRQAREEYIGALAKALNS